MFNSLLLYLIYFHIKLFSSGWFFDHYYYQSGRPSASDVCKLFCYTHKCHCEQISRGLDNNELINECEREKQGMTETNEKWIPYVVCLSLFFMMYARYHRYTEYRPIVYMHCRKKMTAAPMFWKKSPRRKKKSRELNKLRIIFRTMDAFCRVDFLLST